MPRPRSPYLHKEINHHGKICWYVRRGPGPRVRIRGEYGSDYFIAAYNAAIAGDPLPPMGEAQEGTSRIGTSPSLVTGYIYFIAAGPYIKIGFATSVRKRLEALQTAHPRNSGLFMSSGAHQKQSATYISDLRG